MFLFYVVSLDLFATLCLHRNRKAMDWLIRGSEAFAIDYPSLTQVHIAMVDFGVCGCW